MRRSGLPVIAAMALVVGAGCSDSVEATGTPAATTAGSQGGTSDTDSRAKLMSAVEAYSAAYLGGDGATAYGLMSARCRQRIGRDHMVGAATDAGTRYGEQPIATLHVDTLSGTRARVTYAYGRHELDQQSEPWVLEGGLWYNDDC